MTAEEVDAMNLWFRLCWMLVTAWSRPRLELPFAASRLTFRVWPTDLDTSLHMNNGRYLTLMDLGRLDVLVRSGLLGPLIRQRWTPIASAIMIRFRRELRPFSAFRLETRLLGWSETAVVMEQVLVGLSGERAGQVAARALFKGGIYDRRSRQFVAVARLMQEIGLSGASPPLTPEAEAFLAADEALREAAA